MLTYPEQPREHANSTHTFQPRTSELWKPHPPDKSDGFQISPASTPPSETQLNFHIKNNIRVNAWSSTGNTIKKQKQTNKNIFKEKTNDCWRLLSTFTCLDINIRRYILIKWQYLCFDFIPVEELIIMWCIKPPTLCKNTDESVFMMAWLCFHS